MAEGCDEFLNFLSICDAIHDFKTDYPKVKRSFDIILNGLKCRSIGDIDEKYIKYTEDSLIQEYLGYESINYLIGDLESKRYTRDIEIFDKPYNVKLLHIERRGSVIKYLDRMTDIDERELIDFFGSESVDILYDAGINALKNFSEVNKRRLSINHVINREFMNDSATGKSTSEVKTIGQLIDTEEDPIVYDKLSMFNTKYVLTLDKLNTDRIKEMDIHFMIKDKGELLYESQHGSYNSRPSCIEYLERSKYKNDVIYQIKRSGDWLQALSCLDIMREYNGKKGISDNIILMTFDRVLLIYALFLGLNILFTNKDNEVIYFKSQVAPRASAAITRIFDEKIHILWTTDMYKFYRTLSEKLKSILKRAGLFKKINYPITKFVNKIDLSIQEGSQFSSEELKGLLHFGIINQKTYDKFILEPQAPLAQVAPPSEAESPPEILYYSRLETYLTELEKARDIMVSNDEQTEKILNELNDKEENEKYSQWWSKEGKLFRLLLIKIREIKEYFSNIKKSNGRAYAAPEIEPIPEIPLYNRLIHKALSKKGGSIKSMKACDDYLTELRLSIESFDSEENPDYNYYEKTAFIVLACLNEYRTSANVYEQIQAILFDILPSIEGYIKCKEPEIQQFFGGDDYTADCTAYAARNIALHSLGLRTGKIESLGNREKHSVKIPPSAVEFYKKTEKHLEQSTFEERKEWIIDQLQAYHRFMHPSAKRASATRKANASASRKSRASASRKLSAKAISVGGSKTRRKSRK